MTRSIMWCLATVHRSIVCLTDKYWTVSRRFMIAAISTGQTQTRHVLLRWNKFNFLFRWVCSRAAPRCVSTISIGVDLREFQSSTLRLDSHSYFPAVERDIVYVKDFEVECNLCSRLLATFGVLGEHGDRGGWPSVNRLIIIIDSMRQLACRTKAFLVTF